MFLCIAVVNSSMQRVSHTNLVAGIENGSLSYVEIVQISTHDRYLPVSHTSDKNHDVDPLLDPNLPLPDIVKRLHTSDPTPGKHTILKIVCRLCT